MKKNGLNFTALTLSGAPVSQVKYSQKELYFRVKATGAFCKLTNAGSAWRLQAKSGSFRDFCENGAAQELAHYMGEEAKTDVQDITVSTGDANVIAVSAGDGTRVEIVIGGRFAIHFYSPEGKLVASVKRIVPEDGNFRMIGILEKGEGVYGGGEKFDVVNKRGTAFSLYTGDMWNNSKGTYMVVPLFLMTRGAGIYFNHYQNMYTDFGEKVRSEWSVELKNDQMDCYVVASEDMKDALQMYADLTGHAEKPDSWNYGPLICRYGPDFNHLYTANDKEGRQTNPDGAPSGRGFQTLVEGFEAAKMPLTAVITEGWGYSNIFSTKEEKARWQEAVNWLHDRKIKVMLYTRVASTIPSGEFSGFKEEYLVHANVTTNGQTEKTVRIPDTAGDGVNPDSRPGRSNRYVDITNPDAMKWYVDTLWGELIEMGFDGVKIDFCETFPDSGFDYNGTTVTYDWYDPSKIVAGTEHHAYPTYFISAFYKKMNELKDQKYGGESDGFMVLTRGGGIGSQRNPYLWGGDQCRAFDKLDDQLMAVVNSGISGVPFMTYDMAGYRYGGNGRRYDAPDSLEYESRVFARAVAFTALTTCIQTHGTVRNAFELEEYAQEIYRLYVQLHLDLTDYIDRYSALACKTGVPVVRHPVLKYQDEAAVYSINDEFLLGDGLLVAPILEDDTFSRKVYLPRGSWTNLLTGRTTEGGRNVTVKANIAQVPVFVDNDSPDAKELKKIFSGKAWKKIRNWED